ncbi:MAG: T6SS effector amidase Tae4 family protein [Polaribacter sp.]
MNKLTEFKTMWSVYPSEYSVMDDAFSEENSPKTSKATREWANSVFHNTCCVRLCYCLNHTENHKISLKDVRSVGLESRDYITGKNGKYIFNVPNVSSYINKTYGSATHSWKWADDKSRDTFKEEIENKQGIIIFHERSSGLNGHVDLWEKGIVKTYDLFSSANSIEFWEVSN